MVGKHIGIEGRLVHFAVEIYPDRRARLRMRVRSMLVSILILGWVAKPVSTVLPSCDRIGLS